MIYIICMLTGLIVGGASAFLVLQNMHKINRKALNLSGVRWEKNDVEINKPAIKAIKRNFPTHDILTNVPFFDLVKSKGKDAEKVTNQCREWTVAILMIEKRTGAKNKIIIWKNDPYENDKTWILKRLGYKVYVIDSEIEEDILLQEMAA